MFRQHNNIMNEGTTMNLPFIGQIVKINTSNGDEYDAKFTQAYNSLDTNDISSFYIMLKKNNTQPRAQPHAQPRAQPQPQHHSNLNSQPNMNARRTNTYPVPTRQSSTRQAPVDIQQSNGHIHGHIHGHNTQIIDCTKAGTSINIDNLSTKPLPYRIN